MTSSFLRCSVRGAVLGALGAALTFTSPVIADDAAAADDGAASRQTRRTPPSLDDLLGIPRDRDSARSAEEAARREAEEALRRRLEQGQATASAFAEAIEKMTLSAELLDSRFDPGIGTQRVQQDVLAKLSHLIDEASKQQSQSSRQQQSQQQRQQQQQQPSAQQQESQPQQGQQQPGEPQEGEPPPLQQGDVNTMIGETRAEWGALPERIREMLLQGRDEKFSSLYEQLTREYYRRLASE